MRSLLLRLAAARRATSCRRASGPGVPRSRVYDPGSPPRGRRPPSRASCSLSAVRPSSPPTVRGDSACRVSLPSQAMNPLRVVFGLLQPVEAPRAVLRPAGGVDHRRALFEHHEREGLVGEDRADNVWHGDLGSALEAAHVTHNPVILVLTEQLALHAFSQHRLGEPVERFLRVRLGRVPEVGVFWRVDARDADRERVVLQLCGVSGALLSRLPFGEDGTRRSLSGYRQNGPGVWYRRKLSERQRPSESPHAADERTHHRRPPSSPPP